MKKEIVENYIFNGFGFPVIIPLAVFKENARGTKYLDINMEELKDKVAYRMIIYPYAYTGSNLTFLRNYLELSTIEMAEILEVVQQTISNWEKKKERPLVLTDKQRSKISLKVQQHLFNKKQEEISEALLNSRLSSNEVHTEPLILDEFYSVV
jgi:DNA-binding transcriptional regulator YiaG